MTYYDQTVCIQIHTSTGNIFRLLLICLKCHVAVPTTKEAIWTSGGKTFWIRAKFCAIYSAPQRSFVSISKLFCLGGKGIVSKPCNVK